MTITGCYIVKNEAANLAASIESIRAICDEIIVVDTGSTDGTVALAQGYGAKVFHFEWVNNFSKARNYALEQATSDLVVFLDADERFVPALGPAQKAYLEARTNEGSNVFFAPLRNKLGSLLDAPMYAIRIFARHPSARYVNAIHEVLSRSHKPMMHNLPDDGFTIHHFGYDAGILQTKAQRNLDMLRNELEQAKNDHDRLLNMFYIARECSNLNQNAESLHYLNEYMNLWHKSRPGGQNNVFTVAAHALRITGALDHPDLRVSDDTLQGYVDEFLADIPLHPVARYCEGAFCFIRLGDYRRAKTALDRMDDLQAKYDPRRFVGDLNRLERYAHFARAMQADIYRAMGDDERALSYLVQAVREQGYTETLAGDILAIIANQPPQAVAEFLMNIGGPPTITALENMATQMIFYPGLHPAYMQVAMAHMRASKTQSDITAIASLLSPESYPNALKIARGMAQADPVAHDMILCALCMLMESPQPLDPYPDTARLRRIAQAYASRTALEDISVYEMDMIARASKLLFFIKGPEANQRIRTLLGNYPYEYYLVIFNYYQKGRAPQVLVDLITDIPDHWQSHCIANCHIALGVAHRSLRNYRQAFDHFRQALMASPGNRGVAREMRILASIAPDLREGVETLLNAAAIGSAPEAMDEAAKTINAAFGKKDD